MSLLRMMTIIIVQMGGVLREGHPEEGLVVAVKVEDHWVLPVGPTA